jgi:hypothetical protein
MPKNIDLNNSILVTPLTKLICSSKNQICNQEDQSAGNQIETFSKVGTSETIRALSIKDKE